MPPKDDYIRSRIAINIESLAEILDKNQVVVDTGPLYKAAGSCRNYFKSGMWGYTVENLIFRRLGDLKTIPRNVDIRDIVLELSVFAEGFCRPANGHDPLSTLEFNIEIHAEYIGLNDSIEKCDSAWHLDRHDDSGQDNPAKNPEFLHPAYHIHFGGRSLENAIGNNNSYILILDSPRIAHPPMEAVLGVDFVLTNFLNASMVTFRDEGNYISIIKTMQDWIWKPYVESLFCMWQPNPTQSPWKPINIWPQLCSHHY